jgi:hypothetical protein
MFLIIHFNIILPNYTRRSQTLIFNDKILYAFLIGPIQTRCPACCIYMLANTLSRGYNVTLN